MLASQQAPGLFACLVDADAIHHAVRTGKINVFKHAKGFCSFIGERHRAEAVFIRHDNFTGLHITHELCPTRIKRTGLRSKHIAVLHAANAERTEPVRVAYGNQFLGAHHNHGIGALDLWHCAVNCLLDGGGFHTLPRDEVGNHF